ncbi:Hsp70 family protein [Haliscomenobacter hydrossis]|uniref:Heat shock protein 70 n=1 Tax=Haliscomenobacter hydrossis (strain ATCC 27775 / DSM 1100 / LMG 10767 / O) TaxID=760192 RepID=F4L3E3_HALH1|nr:Hsp70 family protein [Haliscomenobacter hydrossis]AEE52920.1 Heat shock protein 70 [Haliscomenobacter hydrossis DSM 1100]
MNTTLESIKELISKGLTLEAIQALRIYPNITSFADNIILYSARLYDADEAKRKDIISTDKYLRLKNQINNHLLEIINTLKKDQNSQSTDTLQYGDEYIKMNHERWQEQTIDGELTKLVQELLDKEKQNFEIKEAKLRAEFKHEIEVLSGKISTELIRLNNLFPTSKFKQDIPDSTFVGIDFGTSNTIVSFLCYYKDRKDFNITLPQTIELPFHKPKQVEEFIIPSAIYYNEENKQIYYGIDAKGQNKTDHIEGKNYWSSFKTRLGIDEGGIFYNSLLKGHSTTTIVNPTQAAEAFLLWLKTQLETYIAENRLPQNVYYTVSIPASFNSNKREAYLNILKKIGIEINSTVLIDEPNAAFLHCLISLPKEKIKALQRQHILVFDFGAGTCDISIVEFWEQSSGIIHSKNYSTSSDNLLGGDNIDFKIAEDILYDYFLEQTKNQDKYITQEQKQAILNGLKEVAEQLKIAACNRLNKKPSLKNTENSVATDEKVVIEFKGKAYNLAEFELSFSDFDAIMNIFCAKSNKESNIFLPIEAALQNAKMLPSDIDYVLLIGGSCKNPYIKTALDEFFTEAELIEPENLQTQVSKGTALNTALIYGLGTNVMDPVVSESISFQMFDGGFVTLIEAGTSIPSKDFRLTGFSVLESDQTQIEIPIYASGTQKMLANHRIIGKFSIEDTFDLVVKVDHNKTIHLDVYQTKQGATSTKIESISFMPYSSLILSPYRRQVKNLERKLFELLAQGLDHSNYNVKSIVREIADLHESHKSHQESLDIFLNYAPTNYANIAYYAEKAFQYKLSSEYTKKAYENDKDGVSAYNYANEFAKTSVEYQKLMKESADFGYLSGLYEYGIILHQTGHKQEGDVYIQKAFEKLQTKFINNPKNLMPWEYIRLLKMAKYLKEDEKVAEIEKIIKELEKERARERNIVNERNFLGKKSALEDI